ncbi:MAG TPA: CDP-alcohol phosphatidyltransferase family protein [Solirubrobacteraceae bacterium]|nr:CDP-alcohol phosphatidyltransferase family protein [Solirubrobacteraceae bacterium]
MPTVAELREATQPASIFERNSGEHWAGRLYMRRLSPYVTRLLLRTPISANGVTWLMIAAGLAAACVLALPGLLPAIGAMLLIQLQLLLDCSDGEVARWHDQRSPTGVYLDRIGHWLTEAALPIALGVRADGGWDELGGYTTLGLVVAVLVLLVQGESALVTVARAESGRPPAADTEAVAAPRASGLRQARRALRRVPFYRAFVAVEFTLLALVAAIVDTAAGDLVGSRTLVVALVVVGAVTAAGHLLAVLTSDRLR